MKNFLSGHRTYIASAALALYAVLGFALGLVEPGKAFELLSESGAIAALRAALAK